jgi:5-methylcytosine-specific restriction protein A
MPRDWPELRAAALARDGYRCLACGRPATDVDHIKPRAAGGTHELGNLRSLCSACHATITGRFAGRRSADARR